MDVKKAHEIIKESQICTGKVKEIRDQTVKKKSELEAALKRLQDGFCQSLVSYRLDEITSGELDGVRSQITEIEVELKEIPALLRGLDIRQKAELERRYNPIAVVRDATERKQQAEEFLRLQEDLIKRAGSTRERGSDGFKRLVKKYKELSRQTGQEGRADELLRRQSL